MKKRFGPLAETNGLFDLISAMRQLAEPSYFLCVLAANDPMRKSARDVVSIWRPFDAYFAAGV